MSESAQCDCRACGIRPWDSWRPEGVTSPPLSAVLAPDRWRSVCPPCCPPAFGKPDSLVPRCWNTTGRQRSSTSCTTRPWTSWRGWRRTMMPCGSGTVRKSPSTARTWAAWSSWRRRTSACWSRRRCWPSRGTRPSSCSTSVPSPWGGRNLGRHGRQRVSLPFALGERPECQMLPSLPGTAFSSVGPRLSAGLPCHFLG